VIDEFDDPVFLLPRPTGNPEEKVAFSTGTFRGELREWLRLAGLATLAAALFAASLPKPRALRR